MGINGTFYLDLILCVKLGYSKTAQITDNKYSGVNTKSEYDKVKIQ